MVDVEKKCINDNHSKNNFSIIKVCKLKIHQFQQIIIIINLYKIKIFIIFLKFLKLFKIIAKHLYQEVIKI